MHRQRALAVTLLLIAFLALAASRAFPFLEDISAVAETTIVIGGAACALTGVWLWLRKPLDADPASRERPDADET